jgi:VWFA-related protein
MRAYARTFAALAALIVAGGGAAYSQQPAATPTEAELVSVDFVAVGADGRPVKTLTREDVALRVGGRERPIYALQYVELSGASPTADRSGIIPAALPDPFGSNLPADAGRLVMLVVNHESISPGRERPSRDAAVRFLRSLSPRDRIGVVTVPRGATLVNPTRDHEQVRSALMQISGQAPQTTAAGLPATAQAAAVTPGQVAASDRACMTRLTLENLTGIVESLGSQDEPKTIVFISGGLSTPTRDAPANRAPGPCELKADDFEAVGKAARGSRAHFYVLQPHEVGAGQGGGGSEVLAGLHNLAGATGGQLFTLAGSIDPVFTQVATETSGYYIVDFAPEASERNGLPHRIEVRVSAPDVKVRHHPQITIGRADGKDPKFLTPHDMLRGVRRFRTLALRAIAYTAQDGDGLAILAMAEPLDPGVKITSAAMGLVDAQNRLVRHWTAPAGGVPNDALAAKFPVTPGNYRLKVAAIDDRGRHGTVEFPFTANLTTAGPLRLSGVALGVANDGQFAPRMIFGDEPAAAVYVEVYGRMSGPAIRIELAETPDGPALASTPARLQPTRTPDRQIALGAVPISGILPGDYVIRVVVTDDGRPLGRAVRTLRKTVKADPGASRSPESRNR